MIEAFKSAQPDGQRACKTPIEDLLRSVPKDLVIKWTEDNAYHNVPIGRHAHEASDEILRLRALLSRTDTRAQSAQGIAAGEVVVKREDLQTLLTAAYEPETIGVKVVLDAAKRAQSALSTPRTET
jgi:hypothetical protein